MSRGQKIRFCVHDLPDHNPPDNSVSNHSFRDYDLSKHSLPEYDLSDKNLINHYLPNQEEDVKIKEK